MAQKWNSNVGWNQDNYIIRCIEETFGTSKSSGKPMITLGFEVVSPETQFINGEDYQVVGQGVTNYYITQALEDDGSINAEKQAANMNRLETLYKAFGLDFTGFNPENPTLGFKGKQVWARLYGQTSEQRKAPTREQAAKNQQGDILKDPITGKPLVNTYPKIAEIYGLAPENPNTPY